jgi:hypothetical protein
MSAVNDDGHYSFLPRTAHQTQLRPLAPRTDTLDGKTVTLWNYMFYGADVFSWLEQGLKARFPGVRFVSWNSFGSIHGTDERALFWRACRSASRVGVDAVISGMGS